MTAMDTAAHAQRARDKAASLADISGPLAEAFIVLVELIVDVTVEIASLRERINRIARDERSAMSDVQGDVNAQSANIQQITAALPAVSQSLNDLVAEVDSLKANNPTIDTSGLDSAVADLQTAAQSLASQASSADPGQPPAPPAPAPGP